MPQNINSAHNSKILGRGVNNTAQTKCCVMLYEECLQINVYRQKIRTGNSQNRKPLWVIDMKNYRIFLITREIQSLTVIWDIIVYSDQIGKNVKLTILSPGKNLRDLYCSWKWELVQIHLTELGQYILNWNVECMA